MDNESTVIICSSIQNRYCIALAIENLKKLITNSPHSFKFMIKLTIGEGENISSVDCVVYGEQVSDDLTTLYSSTMGCLWKIIEARFELLENHKWRTLPLRRLMI